MSGPTFATINMPGIPPSNNYTICPYQQRTPHGQPLPEAAQPAVHFGWNVSHSDMRITRLIISVFKLKEKLSSRKPSAVLAGAGPKTTKVCLTDNCGCAERSAKDERVWFQVSLNP